MARRGGRRGRRSRSKQRSRGAGTRSSKAKSSKSRSRNTRGSGARKSAPSKRRNTRTTTRASNRRATVSKARRAAPKKAAPKKKAPTARRAAPSNRRATVSKARRPSAPKRTAPKKTTPTRTTQQRTNQRGVGAKKTSTPKKAVNASVGKPATSKRQATRINRKPPVKASTAFNNALKAVQNRNLVADKRINAITNPRGALKEADAARKGIRPEVKNPGFLDRILNRNNTLQQQINNLSNAALGISPAAAQPMNTRPKLLANLPADYKQQEQALSAAAKPTGNPDVMSPDGTFNRPGPGGPEPEADYTSYQPGSFYNLSDTNRMNMTNLLRSGRNLVTSPFRAMGIENRLTNKLIPKSNEAIQDARDNRRPRPTLKRRGGSGGASRIAQQVAAQQMQPEIAPTIGTPDRFDPALIADAPVSRPASDFGDEGLSRIQSQAYNTQLTSSLANMFGGQGSVGYTPQGDQALSPTLRAGRSRGRRRVRLFGARRRRGGTGDQFSRAGDRIAKLTNINI